jgi:glycosyltransferase involved in cell wall biosynthesis
VKIGVYSIALNEAKFIERWYQSAKEADFILIADTGSTDETVEIAKKLGINIISISIKPWRFDDARNAVLAHIPSDIDYCIALDIDEQLQSGWRSEIEKIDPTATRPRYKYIWSWNPDGSAGLTYGGDKIHSRVGYRWKHPVHETLTYQGEEKQVWTKLEIHHHPDESKSRSQYFPLLRQAVMEDLSDDRNCFYYARELYFHNFYTEAIKEFNRHLSLPKAVWKPERAASMRYLAKMDVDNKQSWLFKAIAESPNSREPIVDLAEYYYSKEQWLQCYSTAHQALLLTQQPLEYLVEPDAWGYLPHDLIAISSYRLGNFKEALEQGLIAYEKAPWIERLADNLEFYKGAINDSDASKGSI